MHPDSEPPQSTGSADDECLLTDLRACWLASLKADVEAERTRGFRIKCLAAVTLTGVIGAVAIYALRPTSSHFESAQIGASAAVEAGEPAAPPTQSAAAVVSTESAGAPGMALSVDADSKPVLLQVLPGISYESGPSFARFFFEVQGSRIVHAVALHNPERIYFDVPGPAADLRHRSVDMNNDFVQRIRVAQQKNGITRFVLDLKCSCPYRMHQPSHSRHAVEIEVAAPSGGIARLYTTAPQT